jgi:hypothetical protein
MDYPLISPEKPEEFAGERPELVALIRQSRMEKTEVHRLERERVAFC